MSSKSLTSSGVITQVIGPVVDIEFPDGNVPKIYNAVVIKNDNQIITGEVQQLLGDKRVRAVAMSSTEGLRRGSTVTDSGAPISVPVGTATLGRIFNVQVNQLMNYLSRKTMQN